jgi:hypothetical protein
MEDDVNKPNKRFLALLERSITAFGQKQRCSFARANDEHGTAGRIDYTWSKSTQINSWGERMRAFSIVLVVIAMLSGCSAPGALGKRFDEIEIEPTSNDTATLIIYLNQLRSNGSTRNVKLFVDDDKIGRVYSRTYRVHTVPPGKIRVWADDYNDTPTTFKAVMVVVTFGASAPSLIKHNASLINIPADVSVAGGEVYFFRADLARITVLEECEESGDEAQLCEVRKTETRISLIPDEQARQELMSLREVLDDPID